MPGAANSFSTVATAVRSGGSRGVLHSGARAQPSAGGGINFHINGRRANGFCGRLFFLQSQLLSWIAAQAFMFLQQAGRLEQAGSPVWKRSSKNFVSQIVVARLVPVIAAYFVLKGRSTWQWRDPLSSILAALFLMSISATMQLLQRLELRRRIRDDRHAHFLWNYIAARLCGSSGTGLRRRGHQLCATQAVVRLIFAALPF